MTKKQLTKTDNTDLAQSLAEKYGVTGTEHISAEALRPPFLKIAQKMSQECDPTNAEKYMEELKLGEFYCADNQKVYGPILDAIICSTVTNYVEWSPKRQFVGTHTTDSGIERQAKKDGYKLFLQNGNRIVLTNNLFLLVKDQDAPDEEFTPMVFSASVTTFTPATKLISALMQKTGTLFGNKAKLFTVARTNGQDSYYVFGFQVLEGKVAEPVMDKAAFYAKQVNDAHTSNSLSLKQETPVTKDNTEAVDENIIEAVAQSM